MDQKSDELVERTLTHVWGADAAGVGGQMALAPYANSPPIEKAFHKRVVQVITQAHADAAAAFAAFGVSAALRPQTGVMDEVAQEFFSVTTDHVVSVYGYDIVGGRVENLTYKGVTFRFTSSDTAESARIIYDGATRYLVAKTNPGELGAFNITSLPTNLTTINPAFAVAAGAAGVFDEWDGQWFIQDRIEMVGENRSRANFIVYKGPLSALDREGHFYLGDVYFGFQNGGALEKTITKAQGYVKRPGCHIIVMGGYSLDGTERFGDIGLRIFNDDGSISQSALVPSAYMIERLADLGVTTSVTEAEGIWCTKSDGKIYSICCLSASRFAIIEEFSSEPDALDFGPGSVTSYISNPAHDHVFPQTYCVEVAAGRMVNDLTGAPFASWSEILDYMVVLNKRRFCYPSTRDTYLVDVNAAAIPSSFDVEIINARNAVFYVKMTGAKNRQYTITGSPGAWVQTDTTQQRGDVTTGIVGVGVTNVTTVSVKRFKQNRDHEVISFAGSVEVTPTAAGNITVGIPMPVASNFSTTQHADGLAWSESGIGGYIEANVSSKRLYLRMVATGTALMTVHFVGKYEVI